MLETHGIIIANQARVTPQQVEAVRSLLDAGATIPFIARYRKEKTGSLDEVVLSELSDKFVKNPADVVSVNQRVSVTVLTIDPERKRISLSMKSDASPPGQPGSDT